MRSCLCIQMDRDFLPSIYLSVLLHVRTYSYVDISLEYLLLSSFVRTHVPSTYDVPTRMYTFGIMIEILKSDVWIFPYIFLSTLYFPSVPSYLTTYHVGRVTMTGVDMIGIQKCEKRIAETGNGVDELIFVTTGFNFVLEIWVYLQKIVL